MTEGTEKTPTIKGTDENIEAALENVHVTGTGGSDADVYALTDQVKAQGVRAGHWDVTRVVEKVNKRG